MVYSEMLAAGMTSDDMKRELHAVSDFMDELCAVNSACKEKVNEFYIDACGRMHKNHFSEYTAMAAVDNMVSSKNRVSMKKCLDDMGINPLIAKERICAAYDDAVASYGVVPALPATLTDYDYYVTLAMVMADYWSFDDADLDMIAYQFLSDVDAEDTKIWDYIHR